MVEIKLTERQAAKVRDLTRAIEELANMRTAILDMLWEGDGSWMVAEREDGVYLVARPEPEG